MFYQKYIVVKHAFVFIKHSAVTHAVIMYPLFTFTFCLFYYGMQNLYYAKCFYIYGVIFSAFLLHVSLFTARHHA